MMKDSRIPWAWVQEQMAKNPPSVRPNGIIFSGPVRLSFANLFKPGKPNQEGGEGKFGAALLFPPGTNMSVFQDAWLAEAHRSFPKNWDAAGNPVGLHAPFHDQAEKAFGAKPYAGYTPGAIYFSATSNFKPSIVDSSMNPVVDETKGYSGVWAFVGMNVYTYGVNPPRPKKGVGFGCQTVMLIADDVKMSGGGGDPKKDFAGVTITAQTNVAARFDALPGAQQPTPASIMPGGHVGTPGTLQTHPLPTEEVDVNSLM